MCFAIPASKTGILCPCCRDFLWHCKRCWNKWHNGERDKDYEPPEYYGQSMMKESTRKRMKEKFDTDLNPSIKPNKNVKYEEGMYGH